MKIKCTLHDDVIIMIKLLKDLDALSLSKITLEIICKAS